MVYVPEGEFLMGSDELDSLASESEKPQHTVHLDAFWIDQTEVTNDMFAAFLNAEGNQKEGGATWLNTDHADALIAHSEGEWAPVSSYGEHPVILVTWYGARAYCEWAGRRLPTEAEWEKAARGTDGRFYPWGDAFDCRKGNFDDETLIDEKVVPGGPDCDGYAQSAPVGSFPAGASPYRALDMAGNVREWVQDWYAEDYYASSPGLNPEGPSTGEYRVVRGGCWVCNFRYLRTTNRFWKIPSEAYNGFRCARSP
jgi:formylglycine-generating enzyme required for sulfatase activity